MDWNECYVNQQTPWDKGVSTPVLDEIILRHPHALTGQVAVPGCGLGHDAARLVELGFAATGLDIAELAIEKGQSLYADKGVKFILADLLNPDTELLNSFDSIWEHTCLCALPPSLRREYAHGVRSLLKPSGKLSGVFFINPEMDPGEEGPPFGISAQDLQKLWESEGFKVLDQWVPATGYPGRIGRELAMVLTLS